MQAAAVRVTFTIAATVFTAFVFRDDVNLAIATECNHTHTHACFVCVCVHLK